VLKDTHSPASALMEGTNPVRIALQYEEKKWDSTITRTYSWHLVSRSHLQSLCACGIEENGSISYLGKDFLQKPIKTVHAIPFPPSASSPPRLFVRKVDLAKKKFC